MMAIDQTFVTRARTALAGPVACGCGLAACAAIVAIAEPGDIGVPACPFRALTGWWCPGCGLTRATHHLLRGQVGTALRYNLLVVLVLASIAGSWATWMLEASGRRVPGWRQIPVVGWVALVAAAVGFAVIRNLPGVEGLRG